jgi:hypothetical protein
MFGTCISSRIARWHIFKSKIPIWVNFERSCNERCWYIWWSLVYVPALWYRLWQFGIFYGHLIYFMAIWYILWPFGIFYGHLVYFMAIWYILWPFGIFYGYLYIFSRFGMLHQEKSGNHDLKQCKSKKKVFDPGINLVH